MASAVRPIISMPDGSSRPVVCTQCGTTSFTEEVAKSESRWGFTQHKTTLLVCAHCMHIESFYSNRVIFMQSD